MASKPAGVAPGRSRAPAHQEGGSTILIVEDEPDIRQLLRDLTEAHGYRAVEAPDGRAALRVLHEDRPDLILLDLTMPELDGWETLNRIRDVSSVPVIVLTAHSSELDKVRLLQSGADDYVVKPFGKQELLARVAALLRRSGDTGAVAQTYDDGVVAIDPARLEVTVHGARVTLTPLEYRLLVTLTEHPNQVLSREQLLELVWNDPYGISRNAVRLYIGYLRRKLGDASRIETVRGFGYRYFQPAGAQGWAQ